MFDFPATPVLNQTYTSAGIVWQYNGYGWVAQSGNIGPVGPAGPEGPVGPAGAPGPTGGVTIAVSDTEPNLPADNSLWFKSNAGALWLRYRDSDAAQWLQINSNLILPPQDGNEYVMVNGLWRLKSQNFDVTGFSTIDVPVPATAKMAKLSGSIKLSATGGVALRWSTDGSTFPAGAGDYSEAGFYHQAGTGGYGTQAVANVSGWNLTPSAADNLAILHTFDLTMGMRSGGGVFTGKWSGSAYYNTAVGGMVHYYWSGYSNYVWPQSQIRTLRVYSLAGQVFTTGVIDATWVY